jgi:photosystem II stability/assembly factor-like uncharacterized protein
MSDIGFDLISRVEKKVVRKNYKISLITDDTLIYSTEVKSSDPNFTMLLKSLNAEHETKKIVTYTFSFYRVKEAKAPWTLINNNLPENRFSEGLMTANSKLFTISKNDLIESSDSFFVSHDFGLHWKSVSNGLPGLFGTLYSPTCMAAVGGRVFVGSQTGIYSSESNGNFWTKVNSISLEDSSSHIISMASANKNVIVLADSLLYISNDEGVSWRRKSDVLPNDIVTVQVSATGNNVIVGGMRWSQEVFLLSSTDSGESWSDISKNVTTPDYPGLMVTSLHITEKTIFLDTQYGLFLSRDKGNSWKKVTNGLPSKNSVRLGFSDSGRGSGSAIIENGTNIFYGYNKGVFLSANNGDSWSEVNNDELRNGVNSIVIADSKIFAFMPGNKLWTASINDLVSSLRE